MSKYKVGDKFVIEINFEYFDNYKIKETDLILSDYTLNKLQKYEDDIASKTYEDGLNDAWELARKIENKLDIPTAREIFDAYRIADILDNFTPQEALAKIEEYEESKAIKVGDEIVVVGHAIKGYVIDKSKECEDCYVVLITNYKDLHTAIYNKTVIKKTGRHIDITQILEQIRGE